MAVSQITKYISSQPAIWRVAPPEGAEEGSTGNRPAAKRKCANQGPARPVPTPRAGREVVPRIEDAQIVTNPSPDQGQAECYCLDSKVSRKTDKKTQFVPFFGCPADAGKRQGSPCAGCPKGLEMSLPEYTKTGGQLCRPQELREAEGNTFGQAWSSIGTLFLRVTPRAPPPWPRVPPIKGGGESSSALEALDRSLKFAPPDTLFLFFYPRLQQAGRRIEI